MVLLVQTGVQNEHRKLFDQQHHPTVQTRFKQPQSQSTTRFGGRLWLSGVQKSVQKILNTTHSLWGRFYLPVRPHKTSLELPSLPISDLSGHSQHQDRPTPSKGQERSP